jgi:hypothetical protein
MHIKTAFSIAGTLVFGAAIGCSGQPAAEEKAPVAETETMASHAANTGAPQMVTGAVLETMDSGGYTYVKVDNGGEEIWAAAGQFAVAVGDRVVFPLETPMHDFHSSTLDRDFPLIYFASFIVPEGEAPAMGGEQAATELPPGHPPLDAFKPKPEAAIDTGDLVRPAGAMAIADVWADRTDLAGKSVTVSGRVVKYNAAILGRNWFHIQDGSGEFGDGTNDLTVTTSTDLAVGDVVTVTGKVAIDQDFGAGYTYTVMIEDASVTK